MVYFIETKTDGPIKIGVTRRLSVRLNQHKTKFGSSIRLLGVMKGGRTLEREIHVRFHHLRSGREELFSPCAELSDFIATSTQNWDGVDEDRKGLKVRIDTKLAKMAQYIATIRDIPLSQFLSGILRPTVEKEFRKAGKDILGGEK